MKGPPLSHNSRSSKLWSPNYPRNLGSRVASEASFWRHRFEWLRRLCLAVNEIAFRELPSSSVFSNSKKIFHSLGSGSWLGKISSGPTVWYPSFLLTRALITPENIVSREVVEVFKLVVYELLVHEKEKERENFVRFCDKEELDFISFFFSRSVSFDGSLVAIVM